MRRTLSTFTFLAALVISGCSTSMSKKSGSQARAQFNQTAESLHQRVSHPVDLDYTLFLPEGYRPGDPKKWPLLLFLHGAGERGSNVWLVAKHGPPKIVKDRKDFPFIVVSPQCPSDERWENESLLTLLDSVVDRLNVDTNRIYLTGLSMGGFGTWALGVAHPERFAAIIPICGGGSIIDVLLSSSANAQKLKSLGIWAFHGAKDPVVPLAESERMVESLKKAGVRDIKLTVYPEAGHDSWSQAYADPDIYDWLLKHARRGKNERP